MSCLARCLHFVLHACDLPLCARGTFPPGDLACFPHCCGSARSSIWWWHAQRRNRSRWICFGNTPAASATDAAATDRHSGFSGSERSCVEADPRSAWSGCQQPSGTCYSSGSAGWAHASRWAARPPEFLPSTSGFRATRPWHVLDRLARLVGTQSRSLLPARIRRNARWTSRANRCRGSVVWAPRRLPRMGRPAATQRRSAALASPLAWVVAFGP